MDTLKMFKLVVKKTKEVPSTIFIGKVYSEYGDHWIGNIMFAASKDDEKCGFYCKYIAFAVDPSADDSVIDLIKFYGENEEVDDRISEVLEELCDMLGINVNTESENSFSEFMNSVVQVIPDPKNRSISFPMNIKGTSAFAYSLIGENWLGVEWSADKSFSDMAKEFLYPVISAIKQCSDSTTKDSEMWESQKAFQKNLEFAFGVKGNRNN